MNTGNNSSKRSAGGANPGIGVPRNAEAIPGGPQEPGQRFPTLSLRERFSDLVEEDRANAARENLAQVGEELSREERNAKFLKFGPATYLISSISGENILGADKEKAAAAAKTAMAAFEEARHEDEEARMNYSMLRAFAKETMKEGFLEEYSSWVAEKEGQFEPLVGVYGDVGGQRVPLDSLKKACERKKALEDVAKFAEIMFNEEQYAGTAFSTGELEKKMYDAWYGPRSARAVVEAGALREELAAEIEIRNNALARVGELTSDGEKTGAPREGDKFWKELESLRALMNGMKEQIAGMEEDLKAKEGKISALEGALKKEKEASAGLAERSRKLTVENDMLRAQKEETAKEQEALSGLVSARDKRVAFLEGENARLGKRVSELSRAAEPGLPERETMVSLEMPVPPEVAAVAKESGGRAIVEDSGKRNVPVADRTAELPMIATVEASRMGGIAAPDSEEIIGEIDIERDAEEISPATSGAAISGNVFGRAIRSIFVYGFAGKGERMEVPLPEEYGADKPDGGDTIGYFRAHSEYHSWHATSGRLIRSAREKVIETAGAISKGYQKNRRKVLLVAAGAIGVAGLFVLAVVRYNAYGQFSNYQKAMQKQMNTPVPALVSGLDSRQVKSSGASPKPVQVEKKAEVAPVPKAPPYDLEGVIASSFANNGLSKLENAGRNSGPDVRKMFNVVKKIENLEERFAGYAYLCGVVSGNPEVRGAMSAEVARDILVMSMGVAREFATSGNPSPAAVKVALEISTTASGVLNGKGGFEKAAPTQGQAVLVKSVKEWMEGVAISAPGAGVEDATVVSDVPAGSPTTEKIDGAPSLPSTVVDGPGASLEPKIVDLSPERLGAIYSAHGIAATERPSEIYAKAMTMGMTDRFIVLEDLCNRIFRMQREKKDIGMSRTIALNAIINAIETGIVVYNTPKLYIPEGGKVEDRDLLDGKRYKTLMRVQDLVVAFEGNGLSIYGKKMDGKQKAKYEKIMVDFGEEVPRAGKNMMRGRPKKSAE